MKSFLPYTVSKTEVKFFISLLNSQWSIAVGESIDLTIKSRVSLKKTVLLWVQLSILIYMPFVKRRKKIRRFKLGRFKDLISLVKFLG